MSRVVRGIGRTRPPAPRVEPAERQNEIDLLAKGLLERSWLRPPL